MRLSMRCQRPEEGHPQLIAMLEVAIEHRLMHAETLAYMLHRLPSGQKICGGPMFAESRRRAVEVACSWRYPRGSADAGAEARATGDEFGWDNELEAHEVDVAGFAIESGNVTNQDFLRFIQAGGYENRSLWSEEAWEWKEKEGVEHPAFWRRDGNLWMYRAMFGEIRLPLDWPVYVSHAEATAYAKWLGRKLPSEAQFHRAAYGTPERRDGARVSMGRRGAGRTTREF